MNPGGRYVDMAIRLTVCRPLDDHGHFEETGQYVDVGGVWDRWAYRYVPDRDPETRLVRTVSAAQLGYALSDRPRIMAAGGRGGGKTEALAQRCERLLLERPGSKGLIVSPIYKQTKIVWRKLLHRMHRWVERAHRTDLLVTFITGSEVRFLSADNPESLRGWDAHWAAVDEEKDVTDEAITIVSMCLRESGTPMVFGAGTPELGEYSERYAELEARDPGAVFRFPALSNPFTDKAYLYEARPYMSQALWEQEAEARFVRTDSSQVAKGFDRDRHRVDDVRSLGKDITQEYTAARGKRARWIVGADYNHNFDCVAWVHKVYAGNRWIVHDRVAAETPGKLALALDAAGYPGADVTVVDDASGEWMGLGGKRDPNSSSRMMRQHGYDCRHRKANPGVKDRVNAFLALLDPADGSPPKWGYLPKVAKVVQRTMENCAWNSTGREIDKEGDWDHDLDAGTYPIIFFQPAARLQAPRVRPV